MVNLYSLLYSISPDHPWINKNLLNIFGLMNQIFFTWCLIYIVFTNLFPEYKRKLASKCHLANNFQSFPRYREVFLSSLIDFIYCYCVLALFLQHYNNEISSKKEVGNNTRHRFWYKEQYLTSNSKEDFSFLVFGIC